MTEPSAVVAAEQSVPQVSNNQKVRIVFCSVFRMVLLQSAAFPFAWVASVSSAYQNIGYTYFHSLSEEE